ncbi:hypothetical protein [Subtercola vilae]|uniref:hypothetical protein n=1 Tax=Subtercola vilae TaxID=2056433 RepID=UPI0010AB0A92|nr:hypothetical protein [Subtercola vilae]
MSTVVDLLTEIRDLLTKMGSEQVQHEVRYNNGQSVKDSVARVESSVADLLAAAADLQAADDARKSRDSRGERGDLGFVEKESSTGGVFSGLVDDSRLVEGGGKFPDDLHGFHAKE